MAKNGWFLTEHRYRARAARERSSHVRAYYNHKADEAHAKGLVQDSEYGIAMYNRRSSQRASSKKNFGSKLSSLSVRKYNASLALDTAPYFFRLVFAFVLLFNIMLFVFKPEQDSSFTFAQFLSLLQNAPVVDVSWITELQTFNLVLPSWLSWVQSILDLILFATQFIAYLLTGFYQLLKYLWYFIRVVF